ncbi:MAG: BMP family ABC transporter substrate-binding protein [Oscillospiraceae bacterium]|nr:BMP family ABC transporter substrate-binding protein [Oscillospiraceae bacterium]
MALASSETYELALVTDLGTIDDRSFNQGSWEGLVKYAGEFGVTHKYYQPKEQSDDAYLDSIQLAVEAGAKLVVTPGYLFETPVFIAQDMYPDVKFVLIDGYPHSADYSEYRTEANTVGIQYAEEQSGFLAGYAVVKDGFTKLGFMGGMAVPAVIRFGYGFVQGAEYAAKELGVEGLTINYNYTGVFAATPEAQALAATWYNDGVEVIFGCGGKLGNSAMAAAEAAPDKWVIGVDVDQSGESERVITSAAKALRELVYQSIDAAYKGEFPGGESLLVGADRGGVELPMASSRFRTFSQADYEAIYEKLVAREITLKTDTATTNPEDLSSDYVKVTVVK